MGGVECPLHNRRSFLANTAATAGALGLATSWPARALAADPPSIVVAYPSDVPSWDPIAAGASIVSSLYQCVFDKVTDIDPEGAFGPSVGGFKWLDGEGKVLEITVRDGATFHNGDPVTSADIRFTFLERCRADTTLLLGAQWNPLIDDIETPTPNRAIFRFKLPVVTAPQLLVGPSAYIVPKAYFEKVGRDAFAENPVGSGPYKVVDWVRDSRIVLEAYDKYWGGAAPIKRVTLQIMKNVSARIAAIQAGQVDFVHNLPVREVTRLSATPGLTGNLHPINNVLLIHMVNKGIYRDPNLRLAMHHAIDKQALSDAFFAGQAKPLSMWEAEGLPANDPTFKFPFSLDQAKALLAKSGYGPANPAKIVLITLNGVFPNDYDMARALVQMWKAVNIEAELRVMELPEYSDMSRSDKLDAPALYSWTNSTGDPESYSGTLLDPSKRNSVWKSDDVLPRLQPLYREPDYAKRMAGYRALDRWVVEQGYAVPILQGVGTPVFTKRLRYVPFRSGSILPYHWTVS